MGFFDFLRDSPRYAANPGGISRLNKRYWFLVRPYVDDIAGSSVLDLASHDGRWSYALSAAGAREVVGVEARTDLIEQFESYPPGPVRDRVSFAPGDVYEVLPRMVAEGRTFDVVALFGLYYHVMDHYGLLKLITALQPRLVIVDSEFYLTDEPAIRVIQEGTAGILHSIPHVPGQVRAPAGIPSKTALTVMAGTLGYGVEWADWETVSSERRAGLASYYREPPEFKRRDTCALRPLR